MLPAAREAREPPLRDDRGPGGRDLATLAVDRGPQPGFLRCLCGQTPLPAVQEEQDVPPDLTLDEILLGHQWRSSVSCPTRSR
jgi:hypothetical protein